MKVYIQTHGCSNNFYESEVMMGILTKNSFEIVSEPENSEVIIINICTVKGTETAMRTIRKLKTDYPEKKLVITGCISKDIIPKIRKIDEEAPLVNTHHITAIVEVIEELTQGNVVEALVRDANNKINLPKVNQNKIVGIVPIASGCVDHCTYCSVKLIKGHIHSYPKEKIIEEVKRNLKIGCKEIWLTSQDNGAYGLEDGEYRLPELLNEILEIRKDFKVRLGMINPHHAIKMLNELIEILQDEKMFRFLHLPVEAGNNEVLSNMGRKYNVFEYKKMIETLREDVEDITIATDMIVGFPGETEIQFHESLQLLSEIKPEVLNISRFHPRPNTKAFKMEQVGGGEIKSRSREMTLLFEKIATENNKKWLGWEGEILIDDIGKDNTFIGRNYAYKQVIVKGDLELGDKVNVKIVKTTLHDLRGEAVS